MALRNIFGESSANASATHSVSFDTSTTNRIKFHSLTITTRAANIGADVKVSILDGARERWVAYLRSGQIYGMHFDNIGEIIIANGACSITTSAGGAGCIVVTSAVCEPLP